MINQTYTILASRWMIGNFKVSNYGHILFKKYQILYWVNLTLADTDRALSRCTRVNCQELVTLKSNAPNPNTTPPLNPPIPPLHKTSIPPIPSLILKSQIWDSAFSPKLPFSEYRRFLTVYIVTAFTVV